MIIHVATPARPAHPGTRQRADTNVPRLPLYLLGQRPSRVEVDGPALLNRQTGKAPRRYPFARISRIISAATVEWSAAALQAVLHNGLPIVFLDRHGMPQGYLHPPQQRPSTVDALLHELADRPDGLQLYNDWLRAERMRCLCNWRAERLQQGLSVNEADYRELVRRHVHQGEEAQSGLEGERFYRSAIDAYALQQTLRAGARPTYWTVQGQPLSLTRDLAGLLCLDLALRLHGLGAAVRGDEGAHLTILHSFGQDIETQCREVFGRLHKHMREVLERWL